MAARFGTGSHPTFRYHAPSKQGEKEFSMSRALKSTAGIFATLAILTLVIFYVGSSIDSIVKKSIEKYGSQILKARVSVDAVEISPTNGRGRLRGVFIGSPAGFDAESIFELDEVIIAIDIESVTGNPVIIKEISVNAPKLTYELNEKESNFDALQRNIKTFANEKIGGLAETGAKSKGGRKLVIEKLSIHKGTIRVHAPDLRGKEQAVSLPALSFKNIGTERNGTAPNEVVARVLSAVKRQVVTATAGLGIEEVRGIAEEGVEGIADILEEGAEGISEAIEALFGE